MGRLKCTCLPSAGDRRLSRDSAFERRGASRFSDLWRLYCRRLRQLGKLNIQLHDPLEPRLRLCLHHRDRRHERCSALQRAGGERLQEFDSVRDRQRIFEFGTIFQRDPAPAGQIYVSVDQTNGGAGFGSSYGPTYPMATYGGNADYAHYDLTTDFYVQGFAPFCPDGVGGPLCANGAPLHTASGEDFVISFPFAPAFSIFSSTVSVVPEPSTWAIMLIGFTGLAFAGRRRAKRAAVPRRGISLLTDARRERRFQGRRGSRLIDRAVKVDNFSFAVDDIMASMGSPCRQNLP